MKCNENKNINKEKEKDIEEICILLKRLNKKQLGFVKYFIRGLLGVPLSKGGNENYER